MFQLKQATLLLLATIVGLLFYSCEKDNTFTEIKDPTLSQEDTKVVFNISDQAVHSRSASESNTVLGNQRDNPFTVTQMAQAHRNLYQSTFQQMETTDLYVQFNPQSNEDMQALIDSDEFFYDFPLDYEVLEMGDYYQELVEGTFPTLYAIVDPSFPFPEVNYQILAELHLDRSDPLLLAESFRLSGYTDQIYTHLPTEGKPGTIPPTHMPIPIECGPQCISTLQIDTSTVPISWEWICDCTPTEEVPIYKTNDCGCEVYNNARKPGGCVKVEDTQLSERFNTDTYEPVRRVKVIIKDTWFTEDETWTDDGGCWKIDEEYKVRAWMWIKFKNERCKIRGVAKGWKTVWQWLFAVKDYVGKIKGPVFNNIEVNYHMWQNQGSQGHRYWGAAMVNNAVHEFYDFSAAEGINPPPRGLDVFVGWNSRNGYALMSGQQQYSQAVGAVLLQTGHFLGPFGCL